MSSFDIYIDKLKYILEKNNVCSSHGLSHAIIVMINAKKCINHDNNTTTINNIVYKLNNEQIKSILLAALLHDADDSKFFPNNLNYENLKIIIEGESEDIVNNVILMVSLVSSSKNGDKIPNFIKDKEWMLIPRYADRLEAIGIVGIQRCYKYGQTVKNPLFVADTPRCSTISDIWNYATEERYNSYTGKSNSMIDHYYDKLIRLTIFPFRNKYLDYECNIRRKPIIDFILYFGNTLEFTEKNVEDFIKNYH